MKLKRLSVFKTASMGLLVCACASSLHAQQIINTIAGNGTSGYSGDGLQGVLAELATPEGVAVDGKGNTYIADKANERVRKIDAAGIITTLAGNGSAGYTGDGLQGTAAELYAPTAVATDTMGNVYICDSHNNVIRKVNTSGVISTIVGNGTAGFSGDGALATACELNAPQAVYVNAIGNNYYIADNGNNRVRKVDGSGKINTMGGNGTAGFSGDGNLATAAELNGIMGITVDAGGNVYVSDQNNYRVRKITQPGRIISTFAGNGTAGFSGDGNLATTAELNTPCQVTVDSSGNVYIADAANNRVRRVTTDGSIATIAGNGTAGFSGDGGLGLAAEFNTPTAVAVDWNTGNVYIADMANQRIREMMTPLAVNEVKATANSINVYPNPSNGVFTIQISNYQLVISNHIEVYNLLGEKVCFNHQITELSNHQIDISSQPAGIYFIKVQTGNDMQVIKVLKQ